MTCKICGSYAINEHLHGREKGKYLDLCDVCYWRKMFDSKTDYHEKAVKKLEAENKELRDKVKELTFDFETARELHLSQIELIKQLREKIKALEG